MPTLEDRSIRPFKVLELFAGSRSIGNVCDRYGFEVRSLDVQPFDKIDYVTSLLDWDHTAIDYKPDFIWASPPCTTYSLLAIRHHRRNLDPISEFAKVSDQLLIKLDQIITYFDVPFMIENPMAVMRKMPIMQRYDRRTVTYCSYGDHRMKPTDLWSNSFQSLLLPTGITTRDRCFNGNPHCHHDRQSRSYAVRKAKDQVTGGTTGMGSNYERSKLPRLLCVELLLQFYQLITGEQYPVNRSCGTCKAMERYPSIRSIFTCGAGSTTNVAARMVERSTPACSFHELYEW